MIEEPQDDVSAIIAGFAAALSSPAEPLSLVVRFQVREGDQAAVEAAFAAARGPTGQERGVMSYDLNREAADDTRFLVYERWRSLADLEAHLRTEYIAKLRKELSRLIIGAPEFHVFVPAWD